MDSQRINIQELGNIIQKMHCILVPIILIQNKNTYIQGFSELSAFPQTSYWGWESKQYYELRTSDPRVKHWPTKAF